MGDKHWQHPAETITRMLQDNDERSPIQIFTDGSKTKKGVGAGFPYLNQATTLKVSNAG